MYRHNSMCLQKNVCKLVFGLYTNEIVFDYTVCLWPPYLKDFKSVKNYRCPTPNVQVHLNP